jgi:hypothetical protein
MTGSGALAREGSQEGGPVRRCLRAIARLWHATSPDAAPIIESLEARQLLASSAWAQVQDYTLKVTGTGRADVINVRATDTRYVVALNGERKTFLKGNVDNIDVFGGRGGDAITIRRPGMLADVAVFGGAGSDKVSGATDWGAPVPDVLLPDGTLVGGYGLSIPDSGGWLLSSWLSAGWAPGNSPDGPAALPVGFDPTPDPAPAPDEPTDAPPDAPADQTVYVYASDFGAVGDGIANDAPALQAAIDAAPAGATLVLGMVMTYKLDLGLTITKPLSIEGNGSTLLLNTTAHPGNETLMFQSTLGEAHAWTQTPKAGDTHFPVAVPADEIAAGDLVIVELGQDPFDSNEPHFQTMARVVENSGSELVLDTPVPYDIRQGAFTNKIFKVEQLVEGGTVRNLNFNHTATAIPDANIYLQQVRGMTFENIGGTFTILLNVADSQDIVLRHVTGNVVRPHVSAGRVLTAWNSDRVWAGDIDVTTDLDLPVIFLENSTRDTTIDGITVHWNSAEPRPRAGVFHFTGGSHRTFVTNVQVLNPFGPINLATRGSQWSAYHFGKVRVSGTIKAATLASIDDLTYAGRRYANTATVSYVTPILAFANDFTELVAPGVVKRLTARLTDPTGVSKVFLVSDSYAGWDLTSRLAGGQLITLNNSIGTDAPATDWRNPNQYLHLFTGAVVGTGAILELNVEYYTSVDPV